MITVSKSRVGRSIPAGFVGLSLEYSTVPQYTGTVANPVLTELILGLQHGRATTLRIGGDSTDWSWWPVAGVSRPRWVNYDLSPRWTALTAALAQATRARVILGIPLAANSTRIASAEARMLINGIGRRRIEALEIGNEPDRYVGRGFAATYGFSEFHQGFLKIASALPSQVPIAGPATGSRAWLARTPRLLGSDPRLAEVTFHRYALNACVHDPSSRHFPTVTHLLAPVAMRWPPADIRAAIVRAHSRGLAFRVDEFNSVTCAGTPGVSDTFASALWMLDALFAMANAGVDAVNIHVHPEARSNELCTFTLSHGQWLGAVHPNYYGVLMFSRAAPPGARLIRLTTANIGRIRSWATLGRDGRIRVTVINPSLTHAGVLLIRAPAPTGPVILQRLSAASAYATGAVTIAGQSFGRQTTTGKLTGSIKTSALKRGARGYTVMLPAASAALVTIG